MVTNKSQLFMLTGERGVGKTTFCKALASHARQNGWRVGGIITPVIFAGNEKVGILAENLDSGETHPLASLAQNAPFDMSLGKWYFDRSVIDWGNQVIHDSLPCDLLIIDEYGPLELLRHEGWWTSVDVFNSHAYRAGLVVVRPELEALARQALNTGETLFLGDARQTGQLVRDLWSEISSRNIAHG